MQLAGTRRWWRVALLGLANLGAYGLALYSFGVLIGPIHEDTGWSHGALSAAFSLGLLVSGLGAILSGRIVDRVGGRPVMLASLALASTLFLVASRAESIGVFVLA